MSEHKSKQAQFIQAEKKRRSLLAILGSAGLIVVALLGWSALGGRRGKYPSAKASQGQILIPAAEVSDGRAHFFTYQAGETEVNFLVLKSLDGQIRAAIDSCDVCYRGRLGYRQEGGFMVCNKCNQRFHSNLINEVKGGCNPVPLTRAIAGNQVAILESDLIQGAAYFRLY
ncbi:MAG TPA: DUF2318 domain-containing protein [Geothrix sp.]|jgi:uncharacterized membrane protein